MCRYKSKAVAFFVTILFCAMACPHRSLAQSADPLQQLKDVFKKKPSTAIKPASQPKQPGTQPAAAEIAGPFAPPAGTKVEQFPLAPVQQGGRFYVSKHGVHVAAVVNQGSRVSVVHDGAVGPKFDEILAEPIFSPDSLRYAYCGRAGNEFAVMLDGKEIARGPVNPPGGGAADACQQLGFTSNSKHLHFVNASTDPNGQGRYRLFFDGTADPAGTNVPQPAFSADGDHYAYVQNVRDAGRARGVLIVDGKPAAYEGGGPLFSADSKHLFTMKQAFVANRAVGVDLLEDGKPIMRAEQILVYGPIGNTVLCAVTAGQGSNTPTHFLTIGNRKIPGSETHGTGVPTDKAFFSPDGKHYAVLYTATGKAWIFADGKKGLDYSSVDHIGFTGDSASVVYSAFGNNKQFLVIGDHESDGFQGGVIPVLAPAGHHAGATINYNRDYALLLDEQPTKMHPAAVDNLTFSADGNHYAYWMGGTGGVKLVLDGNVQQASNISGNLARKFTFSPDGNHIAHFGVAPNATDSFNIGIFVDGKYIPFGPTHGIYGELTFTADGKHLFWFHQYDNYKFRVYADGKAVAEGEMAVTPATNPSWWDISPDGTLSFLSQSENSLVRVGVTPSPETSVATYVSGAKH